MRGALLAVLAAACSNPLSPPAPAPVTWRAPLAIAPEVPLGAPLPPGPAHEVQADPRAAFDGTRYLAVWTDGRAFAGGSTIFGARIEADGGVADTLNFPVSPLGPWQAVTPDVVACGSAWVVVWSENRFGFPAVRGAFVDRASAAVSPDFAIAGAGTNFATAPRVACDGARFLVTTVGSASSRAFLFDADGGSITEQTIGPEVALVPFFDGAGWQIASFAPSVVRLRRYASADLAPQPPLPYLSAAASLGEPMPMQYTAGAAGGLLTVRSSSTSLWAAALPVQPGGAVDPDAGFSVFVAAGAPPTPVSAVAADGGLLVLWLQGGQVRGARVLDDGGLPDPAGFEVSLPGADDDALAAASTGWGGVALTASASAQPDIVYALVGGEPPQQPQPLRRLTASGRFQVDLHGAAAGSTALAAWEEWASGAPQIRGALLGAAGQVLAAGLAFSAGNGEYNPAVAAGPGGFLVAWQVGTTSADILVTRVTTDGGTSPPITVANLGNNLDPAVAGFDAGWWVGWTTSMSGGPSQVRVASRSSTGALIRETGLTSSAAGMRGELRLATGEGQALAVWTDDRAGTLDVWGARVLPDGTTLDPDGFLIAGGPSEQASPDVTWDGQHYRVLIHGTRSGLVRVSLDGGVIDPAPLPVPPVFVLVNVEPGDPLVTLGGADGGGVLGRLSLDGGVERWLEFGGERSFLFGAGGRTWVVYQRRDPAAGYVPRVFGRQLTALPDGSPCTGAEECASGVCTANVCGAGGAGGGAAGGATAGGAAAGGAGGGSAAGGSAGGSASGGAPVEPRTLSLGCGCGAGLGPMAWLLLLALLRRRDAADRDEQRERTHGDNVCPQRDGGSWIP